MDPYRACLGVLAAAERAGARLFERSAVTRVEQHGPGVRVHAERGYVDARQVIVATGYATPDFRRLAGRFKMYRTYAMTSRPLSRAQRREIGLGEVMIWDTERPYHYARWTGDHRLLLGGGDRLVSRGGRRDLQFAAAMRELRQDFVEIFPAVADLEIDHAWEGMFAITPDTLPLVGAHSRYPRHLFALGYGGNGMTFGFLAASLLREQWLGQRSRDHLLFGFDRF
jgi:glycine/D-amino acid oxidase-like deaminating enzyme